MAGVNSAPKLSKNRKLAKNKKKSWRASKVEDIEEFLDDERRQILTGGLVTEKSDSSLFIVDKGPNKDVSQTAPSSKRSFRNRPLKCLALLQPDPHSKAVRKPDQVTFQKGKRTQRITDRKNERSTSQVRLLALQQRKLCQEEKKKKLAIKKILPTVKEDLWSGEDSPVKVKRPRTSASKPSALSATPIPHPGMSINPAFDDHQELLKLAIEKEVQKVKQEKKLHNALDAKFPTSKEAVESAFLMEMSAGLIDDSEEEESEEDENNARVVPANPPVRREDRKTRRQKRIEKEMETQTKQKMKEDKIKRRENMVLRIPSIKSEINKKERMKKEKEALKRKKIEEEKFQTKRLGSIKFEEPDLALKLSTELTASYRELKPEGHPIEDIFKSIQRRNIVEPRVKQRVKRKYKPKVFLKKSHKAVL